MRPFKFIFVLFSFTIPALAAVIVTAPTTGSSAISPIHIVATGTAPNCTKGLATMGVYVDNSLVFVSKGPTLNTAIAIIPGIHKVTAQEWDYCGGSTYQNLEVTVQAAVDHTAVSVSTPTANEDVVSPFQLTASDASCEGHPVSTMAWELDGGTDQNVNAQTLNAQVTANAGAHTLHVKSWGKGTACDADIPVTVVNPAPKVIVGAASITEPTQNEQVLSPFPLQATDEICGAEPVSTMAYSLDSNSALLGLVSGTSIDAPVTAPTGSHVLHVKSWGPNNAACVTDVTVAVAEPPQQTSVIPSDAISVSSIQALDGWTSHYDPGTMVNSGTNASGITSLVNVPSLSGFAREFQTSFTNSGGDLYAKSFGSDPNATNFFYDGWVYVPAGQTQLANIEMDFNQVLSNGNNIIFGFQCDGWSSTWDYTNNIGTVAASQAHWIKSSQSCNPRSWTPNVWHHIQIWYSHDGSGNATYHTVWFDGQEQPINATVQDEFALGWASVIQTQFQVDGINTGNATAYLDNLTIYRW